MASIYEEVSTKGAHPGVRFGHTICPLNQEKVCLFGGAAGDQYSITNDTFTLDLKTMTWKKLESKSNRLFHSKKTCLLFEQMWELFLVGEQPIAWSKSTIRHSHSLEGLWEVDKLLIACSKVFWKQMAGWRLRVFTFWTATMKRKRTGSRPQSLVQVLRGVMGIQWSSRSHTS